MKKCSTCKVEQSIENFTKNKSMKDGLSPTCKDCKKKENARYSVNKSKYNKDAKERSKQLYYNYMQDKSCIKCGESDIACLDFDHRDQSEKKYTISIILNDRYSWETILKEINKCDILCANCHRKRTAVQCGWYRTRV